MGLMDQIRGMSRYYYNRAVADTVARNYCR
jgi:hypothetical protein